jgi:hypothetical protein
MLRSAQRRLDALDRSLVPWLYSQVSQLIGSCRCLVILGPEAATVVFWNPPLFISPSFTDVQQPPLSASGQNAREREIRWQESVGFGAQHERIRMTSTAAHDDDCAAVEGLSLRR